MFKSNNKVYLCYLKTGSEEAFIVVREEMAVANGGTSGREREGWNGGGRRREQGRK